MKKILAIALTFAMLLSGISAFALTETQSVVPAEKLELGYGNGIVGSTLGSGQISTFDELSGGKPASKYQFNNTSTVSSDQTNITITATTGASGENGDNAVYLKAKDTTTFTGTGTNVSKNVYRPFCYHSSSAEGFNKCAKNFFCEFDVKADTNVDTLGVVDWCLYGSNEKHTILMSDGTIRGTNVQYPVGEWFRLKFNINLGADATSKWNVWATIDGVTTQIVTNVSLNSSNADWNYGHRYGTGFVVGQPGTKTDGDTLAGFAVDNFRVYHMSDPAEGHLFAPAANTAIDDSSVIPVSAVATGSEKVEFSVTGADGDVLISTFEDGWAMDSGRYTFSDTIDLYPYDLGADGAKTLKVTKYVSGTPTVVATQTLNYTKKNFENIRIADASVASNKITASFQTRGKSPVTALTFAAVYDETGGIIALDTKPTSGDDVEFTLSNLPNDYSADKYTTRVYLMSESNILKIADYKEIN